MVSVTQRLNLPRPSAKGCCGGMLASCKQSDRMFQIGRYWDQEYAGKRERNSMIAIMAHPSPLGPHKEKTIIIVIIMLTTVED